MVRGGYDDAAIATGSSMHTYCLSSCILQRQITLLLCVASPRQVLMSPICPADAKQWARDDLELLRADLMPGR